MDKCFKDQYYNIWFQWSYIQFSTIYYSFMHLTCACLHSLCMTFGSMPPPTEQLYLSSSLRDCHFPNLNWSLGKITLLTASVSTLTSPTIIQFLFGIFSSVKIPYFVHDIEITSCSWLLTMDSVLPSVKIPVLTESEICHS